LTYLEKEKIVHRNITTKSFFVRTIGQSEYVTKLGDFSTSKRSAYQYTYSTEAVFSLKSSAPEILEQGEYSSKSDVYAFGGIFYSIFPSLLGLKTIFPVAMWEILSNGDGIC